ncbi:MAG: hypothetical protein JWR37_6244 [Mycobacterium sp.]|jgi:hypothetical protein|nr:hypothetical protein [Mycobacterium sp.]
MGRGYRGLAASRAHAAGLEARIGDFADLVDAFV